MNDEELEDRALRNLLRAMQEAGPELRYDWVAKSDPDFEGFRRRKDAAWLKLVERLAPRKDDPRLATSKRVAEDVADAMGERPSDVAPSGRDARRPVPVPARPLGPPGRRLATWLLITIALPVAAIVLLVEVSASSLAVVLVAVPIVALTVRAANRAYVAWFELRAPLLRPAERARDRVPPSDPDERQPPPPASREEPPE